MLALALMPGAASAVSAEPATTPANQGGFAAIAIGEKADQTTGVHLSWQSVSGVEYYRIFRTEVSGQYDIPLTDFDVKGTSYVDVNIYSGKTYYYIVRPVLFQSGDGQSDRLGDPLPEMKVAISHAYLGQEDGAEKQSGYILMKLDSKYMQVNGEQREVDPGKNTAPVTIGGRTLIPARALVEAMNGTAGWDNATKQVTLKALGKTVVMTLGKLDFTMNGAAKQMDTAPVTRDGRTLIPVRFAGEALGCKIDWLQKTKEILIVYNLGETKFTSPEAAAPSQASAQTSAPTLDDAKKNAQAAGHGIEAGYVAHANTGVPAVKDGFYLIYKNDHQYDNLTVVELSSEADAINYAAAVKEAINSAKVRYYDRFVLDVSIVDNSAEAAFTEDMATQVMKDLFHNEGMKLY